MRLRMGMGERTSFSAVGVRPETANSLSHRGGTAIMAAPTRIRGNDAAESQNGYSFRRLI